MIANKNYVEQNYKDIVSGDKDGAYWTVDGKISDGKPSNESNKDKIVFAYVTNCDGWINGNNFSTKFPNGSNKYQANIYSAKEIHFQFVKNGDFIVPGSKTVVFKSNIISINTQGSDEDVDTNKPQLKGESGSSFFLMPQDSSKDFYVTFPNNTDVIYSGNKDGYTIPAGIYHITSGIGMTGTGVNLFTNNAKDYFTDPDTKRIDIGSGGSGGTTITGGEYTDGN